MKKSSSRLEDAVARGLKFNLGLIDSEQADAQVRAQREHAFAELLPQISSPRGAILPTVQL